jgi:hypothetical protein
VNHAWRGYKQLLGWGSNGGRLATFGAGALTFLVVVVGWVFFRADSLSSAITMLEGMVGINGVSLPLFLEGKFGQYFAPHNWLIFSGLLPLTGKSALHALATLSLGFMIVWMLPNVRQMFQHYRPVCEDLKESSQTIRIGSSPDISGTFLHRLQWKATKSQGFCYGIFFFMLTTYMATVEESEFLYFNF